MNTLLNTNNLTPTASLNRMIFAEVPPSIGCTEAVGKTAHDLLSAEALARLIHERAGALGLDGAAERSQLLASFDACFGAADARIRAVAETIAREYGRRLGLLVATLKLGAMLNRQSRPDWDDSYWRHWAQVQQIWLGGGLASGMLGPHMLQHAAALLTEAGIADCELHRAAHPALLPLIGAARNVAGTPKHALVLDLGQSWCKRAVAHYQASTLATLQLLPRVRAPDGGQAVGQVLTPAQVQRLADNTVAVLAAAWQDACACGGLAPIITVSLASYVADDQPLPRQGGPYSQLHTISDNLGHWLAQQLGQAITVRLLHDGTAAAYAYAGTPRAAVIMLGTALGVGFPPPSAPRPVASHIAVMG